MPVISFVPPACYGTPPCVAHPAGYTVHWETLQGSGGDSKRHRASLYVPVLDAHRMEPARKMRLKTAAKFAVQALGAEHAKHEAKEVEEAAGHTVVFSSECAQPLPGGQQVSSGTQHSAGMTVASEGGGAPTCDCDAAYRMGQSESSLWAPFLPLLLLLLLLLQPSCHFSP